MKRNQSCNDAKSVGARVHNHNDKLCKQMCNNVLTPLDENWQMGSCIHFTRLL
jgi:hypothetical protein